MGEPLNIEPIISSQLFKIFNEELNIVYNKINSKYPEITLDELQTIYNLDASKLAINLGIKKRTRKKLDEEKTCQGRKGDGNQCTRSKRQNSEYCLSHEKNLPHGRIDNLDYKPKEKGQRGRKRKDNIYKDNNDYLPVIQTKINNKYYLCDTNNNVYTNNPEHPKLLGKLNEIENSL